MIVKQKGFIDDITIASCHLILKGAVDTTKEVITIRAND